MHFRCHLSVTLVSTDKEFFENHLAFKLTKFFIVIENMYYCAVLVCVVNMEDLGRKSLILSFDLMWCLSKRHTGFCLMLLVSLE